MTRQDLIGEGDESIIITLTEPRCYCSLVSTFDSRDASLDSRPLEIAPQSLLQQQQIYAMNGSFWDENQTTARLMRSCSDVSSTSFSPSLSRYEDAVELLLDRTHVFIAHHQGMDVLNADAFTISVATTPQEANGELSSAPFATGAGTPEFYGLMRVPMATCPADLLLTPVHGSRSPRWNHYPVNVTFSCNDGYSLQGASTAQCLSNGTWSGQPPSCIANASAVRAQINSSCSQPPSPGPFGFVTLSSANIANYMCAEGTHSVSVFCYCLCCIRCGDRLYIFVMILY